VLTLSRRTERTYEEGISGPRQRGERDPSRDAVCDAARARQVPAREENRHRLPAGVLMLDRFGSETRGLALSSFCADACLVSRLGEWDNLPIVLERRSEGAFFYGCVRRCGGADVLVPEKLRRDVQARLLRDALAECPSEVVDDRALDLRLGAECCPLGEEVVLVLLRFGSARDDPG